MLWGLTYVLLKSQLYKKLKLDVENDYIFKQNVEKSSNFSLGLNLVLTL